MARGRGARGDRHHRVDPTLTWPAAADDVGVAKYVLTKDGQALAELTETTFTVTGLAADTYLAVSVVAVDDTGNASAALDAEVAPAPRFELPTDMPPITGSFCATVQALTSGATPLQTGVSASALSCPDVGIIRARVTTASGSGVPGLHVTAPGHPELGETRTRANGEFDFAAPAGPLVIDVRAAAFLPLQRSVDVERLDFTHLGTLVVTRLDSKSTALATATGGLHVASARTDTFGTRAVRLYIPPGTTASLRFADGGTQPTPTVTVRVTEATVGAAGPQAMPASLPPQTAYTFAADFTVDEAIAAGAAGVTFSGPVAFALENFLHAPVGASIPQGSYDATTGRWEAQPNSTVLKVLPQGQVDTDDDGQADTEIPLLAGEADALASQFPPGTTVWRGVTTHFSALDINANHYCVGSCKGPKENPLPESKPERAVKCGSIIECRNQTLGEVLAISGAPFHLVYASQRAGQKKVRIPLAAEATPDAGTLKGA